MTEHTKTPWRLGRNGEDDAVFSGNDIVAMCDTDTNSKTAKANAAFIVRAVNCHDELVEALEKISRSRNRNLTAPNKLAAIYDIVDTALSSQEQNND